jgi:hypothetical protein
MENSQSVKNLEKIVHEIETIKNPLFGNAYDYFSANELLQRARMYAENYFPSNHYRVDLMSINFEQGFNNDSEKREWNKGIIKLLSITKAMQENAKLIPAPTKVFENTSRIKE